MPQLCRRMDWMRETAAPVSSVGRVSPGMGDCRCARSAGPISSGASARLQAPVASAALGMPSNSAVSGVCAIVRPPASRSAASPFEPSEPVPDRTTPTAGDSPWPSERNRASIG